nr:ThiF family adenylyltransferase [uncultured Pseudogulbenkiania sp.]
METWWQRYPWALEAEKTALDALGYPWEIDATAWASGHLTVHVQIPGHGEALKLRAEYPDSFPYFSPQVFLQEVSFFRHQHLFGKNLCLLAREGEDWRPGQDTLAVLLRDQLPLIQQVNSENVSQEVVADIEDHVGEPFSSFLPYLPNSLIIVPDETPAQENAAGRLSLMVRKTPADQGDAIFVNGILKSIYDLSRKPLIEFPPNLPVFSEKLTGFWMRLSSRPNLTKCENLEKYFSELISSEIPAFKKAIETAKRGQIIVAGFVYPDEASWRRNSDDWFFLAVRIHREAKGARPAQLQGQFIRADWGGENAWMQRAPTLLPLRSKSALILGLGSIGSPLCLHLARAGIRNLHLVDCDYLQVGNTVRWALGWQYAGLHKASALASHLVNEYPYTSVQQYSARIGAPSLPKAGIPSDYQLIRFISEQVDLIIDATANHRVSHFLSDLAQEIEKPYLWLTTTHGGSGGVIGRIRPRQTKGCWHCFQRSLEDGSIRLPAQSEIEEVQPSGCSQPTFIGAGIDSDEVALLAARVAVATLCAQENNSYQDFTWDVAIGDFVRDGQPIAPDWTEYLLQPHSSCKWCSTNDASMA